MKFRTDFVTNSSSSSFLVAYTSETAALSALAKAYRKAEKSLKEEFHGDVDRDDYEYEKQSLTEGIAKAITEMLSGDPLTEGEAKEKNEEFWCYGGCCCEEYAVRHELEDAIDEASQTTENPKPMPAIYKKAVKAGYSGGLDIKQLMEWFRTQPAKDFISKEAELRFKKNTSVFLNAIKKKDYIKCIDVSDHDASYRIWQFMKCAAVYDNH